MTKTCLPRGALDISLAALPTTRPATLLQTLAGEAFFDIPQHDVLELATFLGVEAKSGTSLYNLVEDLVLFSIRGISEEDCHLILQKRYKDISVNDDVMEVDEVLDIMDKDDVKEVLECKKKAPSDNEES